MIRKISLLDLLDKSTELFSMPPILADVLKVVESEDCPADTIATIIMKDPSLTMKVLRMANSAYYRRAADIKSVQQGVRVLGMNCLRCIALSVSIFSPRKEAGLLTEEDLYRLHFHCLAVAILSKAIAEALGGISKEEAFTAGLLHDIGRLYIMRARPKEYLQINKDWEQGGDLIETERRYFDVDHAELGAMIAYSWKMPVTFQQVIRNHHSDSLPRDEHPLGRIVRLADVIVMNIYSTNIQTIEKSIIQIGQLSGSLGIKKELVDNLTFNLFEETLQAANRIGIEIGDTTDLLNRANRELCKAYFTIEGLFLERQELSRKILCEERLEGMLQSKNIAIATLSHYLNNIATAISGRVQLLQMALRSGQLIDQKGSMPPSLKVIETSIARLLAVLAELKSLSSFDDQSFYNDSEALNIDEQIKERMTAFTEESERAEV